MPTASGPFYNFESVDLFKRAIETEQAVCFEPDDIIIQAGVAMASFQDDSPPETKTKMVIEGFKILKQWNALDGVKRYYQGWAESDDENPAIFGKLIDAGVQLNDASLLSLFQEVSSHDNPARNINNFIRAELIRNLPRVALKATLPVRLAASRLKIESGIMQQRNLTRERVKEWAIGGTDLSDRGKTLLMLLLDEWKKEVDRLSRAQESTVPGQLPATMPSEAASSVPSNPIRAQNGHQPTPDVIVHNENPSLVSLVLMAQTEGPVVNGKKKPVLTPARYNVLKALLDAGDAGLSKDQLDKKSGHTDARKILDRLVKSDKDWKSVISLPAITGAGYRLVGGAIAHQSPPKPTSSTS